MSNPDHIVGRSGASVPVQKDITAATTSTQAAAVQLNPGLNVVDVSAADDDAVKLPFAVPGRVVLIKNNDAAQDIVVFPSSGDQIDGGTVDAVDSNAIGEGTSRMYVAEDDTNWVTVSP